MNELGLLIKITEQNGIVPLLERIKSFGFRTCQISTYVPEIYTKESADIINDFCAKNDLRVTLLWAGWPGNCEWNFIGGPDTVGLVPPKYRRERCDIMKKASDFAKLINVDRIATHAGFIPENFNDPLYAGLIEDLKDVALYCKANNQLFCFETGQETPVTLLRTMQDIGTDNLGINLDPANLVMYGKGSAVDSLIVLGSYLKGVHIKDGKYPTDGRELGLETPIGEGHVNMPALLAKLKELNYTDPLTIEIELDRRTGETTVDQAINGMVEYLKAHI